MSGHGSPSVVFHDPIVRQVHVAEHRGKPPSTTPHLSGEIAAILRRVLDSRAVTGEIGTVGRENGHEHRSPTRCSTKSPAISGCGPIERVDVLGGLAHELTTGPPR